MTKREIKFRQWSERNKEMTSWDDLKKRNIWLSALEYETLITEQYTGLKDVKGVEIYEGDFLLAKYDFGHPAEEFGEVKFMDGCWVFDSPLCRENLLDVIDERIEVKGNIHENPEWEV